MSSRAGLLLSGLLALSLVAAAGFVWMHRRPPPAPPASATPAAASEPQPDRSSTRRPVLPIAQGKLVPAAAGVEMRWAQLNHDAIAALDAGDPAKAVAMFEQCLAAVPGEPVFARNLAEALTRLSVAEEEKGTEESRKLSLEHLQRAAELAPAREDVRKRLEQVRRLADSERGFLTERSEHFELSYDGARTDLLWSSSEITRKLENAYQDFGELFGIWPVEGGRARIRVVLYKKSGFHEATGMGHWAVGVFDGAVRVPVEDLGKESGTLERVLRHEVAHDFVRESGGTGVPGWLNEGLAQWLEPPFLVDRGRAVDAARRRLRGEKLLPVGELEGPLGENRSDDEVALAYTEALGLCGWIESSFGERLLFEMVSASRSPGGWRETFKRTAGVEVDSVLPDLPK